MSDYDYLPVSNGSGDAALMHIMSNRSVAATTIVVDTVVNVPAKFIGTSGTLLSTGFIDPTTITNFKGHTSSGNLIIDSFEPGSTDVGNTSGQVVIVKPNTGWANRIATFIKNITGFGTPENLFALSLTTDTINETTADHGVNVDGLNIKDGQLTTSNAAVDMQHFEPSDVTKTTYSSASWTTHTTFTFTPVISGKLMLWYSAEFGFQTSQVSAAFRIQIGGVTVTRETEHLVAPTSFSSAVSLNGYKAAVVAGTPYTITIQTESIGGTYAYYILAQMLNFLVSP